MHGFILRPARPDDADFIADMSVEAFTWSPDRPRRSRADILADPVLARYVAGWPRAGDLGVVAEAPAGERVGACWLRFFPADDPGFGFVSPDVPEIGLAVAAAWRGRGIARALLR